MITIRPVENRRQLKEFIRFPNVLLKQYPNYTPYLEIDELLNLDPKKNPAFDFCSVKLFMAYKDGKLVGRLGGIINNAANEKFQQKRIRFTRFDVIDDLEVTRALFQALETFAKEHQLDGLMGPIGFCDLDKQGLLVEGFDELNMFITLYNPPYYQTHLEALGFAKEADWIELQIKVPEKVDERMDRLATALLKRGGFDLIKPRNKKELRPFIYQAFDVVNAAFAPLYGVITLTPRQIDFYVEQFIQLVNYDYLSLVADKSGRLVAMGLAMPSLSRAMQKANGRLFPFGLFHILHGLKHHDTIDMYLIGIRPEYQGMGLNAIILNDVNKGTVKHGVKFAETGPELELNDKVQSQWKNFETRQHRRRRSFYKPIDAK